MTLEQGTQGRSGLLAVDLGGSRLRVAVFDRDGTMLYRSATETLCEEPRSVVTAMQEALDAHAGVARGAVVGVPGPVDYSTGEVLGLPNLPAWEHDIAAQQLANALGLPVLIANDADLAALGEHRYGAGQGTSDMVYVTVSTGVGAGVIVDGHLLHARRSLAEVGHMIVDPRSGATVEELGSGAALRRRSGHEAAALTARAAAGDERALALLAEVADAIAIGVVNLVYCFMPERVVMGGGLIHAGDLLLDPVRDLLERCPAPHPVTSGDVVLARCGDDAGLLGAFALWAEVAAGGPDARPLPVRPEAGATLPRRWRGSEPQRRTRRTERNPE